MPNFALEKVKRKGVVFTVRMHVRTHWRASVKRPPKGLVKRQSLNTGGLYTELLYCS